MMGEVAWNTRSRARGGDLKMNPKAVKSLNPRNALGEITQNVNNAKSGLQNQAGKSLKPLNLKPSSLKRKLAVDNVEMGISENETATFVETSALKYEGFVSDVMRKHGQAPEFAVDKVDEQDLHIERYVVDYVGDVLSHYEGLLNLETYKVNPEYMLMQNDINAKMRSLLIDWLNQVHHKFELSTGTLFMAITFLDRFLSRKEVTRKKLQLVGCTALWLASKYEEIYAPEMDDFVTISDNAFTDLDLLKMEKLMLETFDYNASGPNLYIFVRRYLKVLFPNYRIQHLTSFILELSLQNISFLKYQHNKLAAAALLLAIRVENFNSRENKENLYAKDVEMDETDVKFEWDDVMQRISKFSETDLEEPVGELKEFVLQNVSSEQKLDAVKKKFSSEKYMRVATLEFDYSRSYSEDEEVEYDDMEVESDDEEKENDENSN